MFPALSGLLSTVGPSLFRNVIGGAWNILKDNARKSANDFVNNTIQGSATAITQTLKPVKNTRFSPFADDDEPEDYMNQEDEEDEEVPRGRRRTRGRRGRRTTSVNNRKRIKN